MFLGRLARWLRPSLPLGRQGENAARRFLRRKGYRILAQNFSALHAEIDLVCQDAQSLVFVEVKTLSDTALRDPEDTIGPQKERHLRRAANAFVQRHRLHDLPARFDVVAVTRTANGHWNIDHVENAF